MGTYRKLLILPVVWMLGLTVCAHAQTVSFFINSGTENDRLKANAEKNISALLTEINRAQAAETLLDFSGIPITDNARQSMSMLWENIHFLCMEEDITERLLTTGDGNYQVRNIPILLTPAEGETTDDTYQEATIDLGASGEIISFYFSLKANLYRDVMANGKDVEDLRLRQAILDYVEHFRTAYNQKDLPFLEQVFSEDALIITGKVVKVKPSDTNAFATEKITYNVHNKIQYLDRLRRIFSQAKYIKVDFSEIKVSRHPTNKNFYGVLVRQGYESSFYSDDGYVFLLWDFTDEDRPQIHVRTWQPYWMNDEKTRAIPESEIMTIKDFKL